MYAIVLLVTGMWHKRNVKQKKKNTTEGWEKWPGAKAVRWLVFVGKYDSLTSNCTNRYRECSGVGFTQFETFETLELHLTNLMSCCWLLNMLPCFANKIIKFNGQNQINGPNSNNKPQLHSALCTQLEKCSFQMRRIHFMKLVKLKFLRIPFHLPFAIMHVDG